MGGLGRTIRTPPTTFWRDARSMRRAVPIIRVRPPTGRAAPTLALGKAHHRQTRADPTAGP